MSGSSKQEAPLLAAGRKSLRYLLREAAKTGVCPDWTWTISSSWNTGRHHGIDSRQTVTFKNNRFVCRNLDCTLSLLASCDDCDGDHYG